MRSAGKSLGFIDIFISSFKAINLGEGKIRLAQALE